MSHKWGKGGRKDGKPEVKPHQPPTEPPPPVDDNGGGKEDPPPEPARDPQGRIRQQQVERGRGLGHVGEVRGAAPLRRGHELACAAGPPASGGGFTSRRKILPVGPFGSWSTSHTCRGYL